MRDVSPDSQDKDSQIPLALFYATRNGPQRVVKILLGWQDINLHQRSNNNSMLIWYVAQNVYKEVFKLLLGWRKVELNT